MTSMKKRNPVRTLLSGLFAASFLGAAVAMLGGGAAVPEAASGLAPQENAQADEKSMNEWKVDSVHSCALFRIRHMGAGFFWGRFNDVTGSVYFEEKSLSTLRMNISIDVESVDSGHPDLDRHLKSPDFFDSKEFPKMTFKSTSAKSVPTTKRSDSPLMAGEVTGELTMHGKSKEITAKVLYWGSADKGRGMRAGFEVMFRVKRSEFGITYGVDQGALGDWVDVTAAFELIK